MDFTNFGDILRAPRATEPLALFDELPKGTVTGLYESQAYVLNSWYQDRNKKDTIFKMHTGAGKTLIGLLAATSTMFETGLPSLYLCPTNQLVEQTLARARDYHIEAIAYPAAELPAEFENAEAVMVAPYHALFNGQSRFGDPAGKKPPVALGALVIDDAHAAFATLRDSFTYTIPNVAAAPFKDICALFIQDFEETGRRGLFEDVLQGRDRSVLEIPYWAWREKEDEIRALITPFLKTSLSKEKKYIAQTRKLTPEAAGAIFNWPFVRDTFYAVHALVSSDALTITPILPIVDTIPTYARAKRRLFMSATINDDTMLIRTFNLQRDYRTISPPGTTGIAERFLCAPAFVPNFSASYHATAKNLVAYVSDAKQSGVVILAPSRRSAIEWDKDTKVVDGENVAKTVHELLTRRTNGPVAFVNRYDGLDLGGDACRLLVLWDLPSATNDYELYRAGVLQGGEELAAYTAQRIEQGMGRGARGGGDYCVVLFVGRALEAFLGKRQNLRYFSEPTKVQWEIGTGVSASLASIEAFHKAIDQVLHRDKTWVNGHAAALSARLQQKNADNSEATEKRNQLALRERAAFDRLASRDWQAAKDDYESLVSDVDDKFYKAWLLQFAGRAAFWGSDKGEALRLQRDAARLNTRVLPFPQSRGYFKIAAASEQGVAIANYVADYTPPQSILSDIESQLSTLSDLSSTHAFEDALEHLGNLLGFQVQRPERDSGVGPDVLWYSPSHSFVLEAKNQKKRESRVAKGDAEQALISSKWFESEYPNQQYTYAVVAPLAQKERDFIDPQCRVMTMQDALRLGRETKSLYERIVSDADANADLAVGISSIINASSLTPKRIAIEYFQKLGS